MDEWGVNSVHKIETTGNIYENKKGIVSGRKGKRRSQRNVFQGIQRPTKRENIQGSRKSVGIFKYDSLYSQIKNSKSKQI